ncbi:hypothetical protein GCM10027343_36650 [Noviherbaspirillum agri]
MKLQGLLIEALVRIVPASLLIGAAAAALGYWHTRAQTAEYDIAALANEAQRVVPAELGAMPPAMRDARLDKVLRDMVGGRFAVAQAYSSNGAKVSEAVQPGFETLAAALATLEHKAPTSAGAGDNPVVLGQQTVRVFTPLYAASGTPVGHLEGIRLVTADERFRYRRAAIESALIGALSVLLCAFVLSPLLIRLAQRNYRWACSLLEAHLDTLETFGRAIAKRDSDTGLHNYRVTWIAARLGEEAGLRSEQLRNLIAGAFLHDIGKIGVPDAILLKPGPLDEHERTIMQTHVEMGRYIVGSAGFLGAIDVVEAHHEKWDGSGYPNKLAGEDIPLNARIFCIADVFDALRAKRPYKEPCTLEASLAILRAGKGVHFDPALLELFERIVDEIEANVIHADEQQAIELMRQMVRKHFFDRNASMAAEGWSGRTCHDTERRHGEDNTAPGRPTSMTAGCG